MLPRNKVRRASKAGSWYESDGNILYQQLDRWLNCVEISSHKVKAIIAPHAGYSYSGSTAAFAYKQIESLSIRNIFVFGPSHHVHLRKCALSSADVLETPVGNLFVNTEIISQLMSTGLFDLCSQAVDEDEHSIEMHLPYVAKIMQGNTDFKVIPIMVGNVDPSTADTYGNVLAPYFDDPTTLFIISSDFCHWGQRFEYQPYDPTKGYVNIHEYISWMDHQGMTLIESQDREGFVAYLDQTHNTICGRNPIILLLATMEKSQRQYRTKFIHYTQSSPVKSKRDSSVSYASAVVEVL